MNISVSRSEISVQVHGQTWQKTLELAAADKQSLQPQRIEQEFSRFVSEKFEPGDIKVQISENPFLPASVLKSLRKEWEDEFLSPFIYSQADAEKITTEHLERFRGEYKETVPAEHSEMRENSALVPRGKHPDLPHHCRIVRELADAPAPGEELLLPFYIDEFSLKKIREKLHQWYERGGRVVRISSLCHLAMVRDLPDVILKTAMPLPICNSLAIRELKDHGVSLVQGSLELGAGEWRELSRKSSLPMELYCFGRPVLLSTRATLPVRGSMTDSKGDAFRVESHGILTQVLPENVMSLPAIPEASALYYDFRDASGHEKNKAHFNFDVSLA